MKTVHFNYSATYGILTAAVSLIIVAPKKRKKILMLYNLDLS